MRSSTDSSPSEPPDRAADDLAARRRAAMARLQAGQPPMRYPNSYVWLVFVSAMDVMLTWAILSRGGTEVNPIANMVIDTWALPGAIAFKFALMIFVILVCEASGRTKDHVGRGLAIAAVAISAIPVVYSLSLLVFHRFVTGDL